MGLFNQKRNSTSSSASVNTTSSIIRKALGKSTAVTRESPSQSAIKCQQSLDNSKTNAGMVMDGPGDLAFEDRVAVVNGHATPSSRLSNSTLPSDQSIARSTTTLPSSVDEAPAKNESSSSTIETIRPRQRLDQTADNNNNNDDRRFSNASNMSNRFNTNNTGRTITHLIPANEFIPNGQAPTGPRLQLPLDWKERDPSTQTRITHSPTPSESISFQAPIPFQRPQHLRPSVSPSPSRSSNYRSQSRALPSLPENSYVNSRSQKRVQMQPQRKPTMRPTPGPQNIIIAFSTVQIKCHGKHSNLKKMENFHHPVPCMLCRKVHSDGMSYCSWCSLRVCRTCSSRLQREWKGDITQGWGMVELLNGTIGNNNKEPVYIAHYGVRNRPDSGHPTMMIKSILDRASQPSDVQHHTAPSRSPQLSTQQLMSKDTQESDSSNNLYSLSASDSHSTISPPSPLTPTTPGTPLALEVAKNVNPDFDFTFNQVTIESSSFPPPERHDIKQSKPTYSVPVERFQKRDNFGSTGSRHGYHDNSLTMQRTNSTINARQVAEKTAVPRHVFTSSPSTIDSTYSQTSHDTKTKKTRRGLLSMFTK